ncbi:hypothetical protein [Psychrobacter sp. DAB_AL43B]|uniref:hypothetical protein n=1 Tax=Psychrobacter sp. DAB_AL43B TaxID=1028416 RepID=UPI0009A61520|nr:hypothetical protein [Psychrobacter sp. DAB_AL43B]SLJ84078.1 hypothetical protein DABAL43B_0879 [Psychrobacter sp. DAB_AL43B]
MGKTTTKASSRLGTLNLYNQSISVPTLVNFELTTDLTIGANNQGTGVIDKKGLVFNKTYKFLAKLAGSKNSIESTKIVWVIRYTSPSTSQNKLMALKAIIKGPEFELDLKDKHKDMAGCEIEISCHMQARPKKSVSNKYFVHNRFMYFDSGKVLNQVKQRMMYPWMIDQGASSLCGMACLYYILIQRSSSLYKKIAIELHRTGIYELSNGYTIKPKSSMYDIKPEDSDYKNMKMDEVDWIVLASTRSSESNLRYDGIETGSFDQLGAVNWMGMLTRMCKEVAGYSSAKSNDLGLLDVGKTIINKRNFSIDKLFEMDKKYKSGKKIIMMIQPKMIDDKKGDRDINSIHWVVYEGGLQFFDGDGRNVASDSLHIGNVKFDIFTWGYNPKNSPRIISKQGISATNFSNNYYGHIEVK